jgi:hypothetical protein
VTWAELRRTLIELRDAEPGVLTGYPNPGSDDQQPPFSVRLAPWAVAHAERLHRRFGAEIELTVGVLGYPMPTSLDKASRPPSYAALPELTELDAQLDGEAVVRSGEVLEHGVLLANRGWATPCRLGPRVFAYRSRSRPSVGTSASESAGSCR